MRVGRRDFLKGVGLCGVGAAGAVATTACGVKTIDILTTRTLDDEKKIERYLELRDKRFDKSGTDKEYKEYLDLHKEVSIKNLELLLLLGGAGASVMLSALGMGKGKAILKGKEDRIQGVEELIKEMEKEEKKS